MKVVAGIDLGGTAINYTIVNAEEQFVAALLDNPHLEQAQQWVKEVRREIQEKSRLAQTAGAANGGAGDSRPAMAPQSAARPGNPAPARVIRQASGTYDEGHSGGPQASAPVSHLSRYQPPPGDPHDEQRDNQR